MGGTPAERFWAKVNKDGPIPLARPELGPCWEWGAAHSNGYGRFSVARRMVQAHRFAYELLVGPIPEGLELDHLCRNHACVNPAHLEPVIHVENIRRGDTDAQGRCNRDKTHCPAGHPLDEANTYHNPHGWRACRTCNRESTARYRAERAAKAA